MDKLFASWILALASLFLSLPTAKSEPFVNQTKAIPTTTTLRITDIDVAVALGKHLMGTSQQKGQYLVIQTECSAGDVKNAIFLPSLIRDDKTTSEPLIDLRLRNRQTFLMKDAVTRGDITIIGSKTVNRMLSDKTYEKNFPSTKGFIYMWLPGYNKKHTEAMVYIYSTGGDSMGLDMWGGFAHLKREGAKWVVASIKTAWQT